MFWRATNGSRADPWSDRAIAGPRHRRLKSHEYPCASAYIRGKLSLLPFAGHDTNEGRGDSAADRPGLPFAETVPIWIESEGGKNRFGNGFIGGVNRSC
jgi:hypothetical protein